MVIRVFYEGIDTDEVKKALDIIVPDVVSKVCKFPTPYSVTRNIETALVMATFLPGKPLKAISDIKYVLSHCITWEKANKVN